MAATPEQLSLFMRLDPVVSTIVNSLLPRLPRHLDRADLMAAGRRGLWDAILRGKTDAAFDGYARIRIYGAIIDELRTQDWMPKGSRRRVTKEEGVPTIVWIEDLKGSWETGETDETDDPAYVISREREIEAVIAFFPKLLDREQQVLTEHYLHDRSMKDIAKDLGITQARASQLHARGLNRLRSLMTGEDLPSRKAGKPQARRPV